MKNIDGIEYLVGDKNISKRSVLPYDNNICDFLGDLSDELNSTSESKKYPDIKTLAFWCRRQNIYNLKKNFSQMKQELVWDLFFTLPHLIYLQTLLIP